MHFSFLHLGHTFVLITITSFLEESPHEESNLVLSLRRGPSYPADSEE